VCSRYGALRRSGRGASLTELPPLGSVAQARTRKPNGLLMAFLIDVNRSAPAADTDRTSFLGKVHPEAGNDPEPFMESEAHINERLNRLDRFARQ
jgi:hypothetical protein